MEQQDQDPRFKDHKFWGFVSGEPCQTSITDAVIAKDGDDPDFLIIKSNEPTGLCSMSIEQIEKEVNRGHIHCIPCVITAIGYAPEPGPDYATVTISGEILSILGIDLNTDSRTKAHTWFALYDKGESAYAFMSREEAEQLLNDVSRELLDITSKKSEHLRFDWQLYCSIHIHDLALQAAQSDETRDQAVYQLARILIKHDRINRVMQDRLCQLYVWYKQLKPGICWQEFAKQIEATSI